MGDEKLIERRKTRRGDLGFGRFEGEGRGLDMGDDEMRVIT